MTGVQTCALPILREPDQVEPPKPQARPEPFPEAPLEEEGEDEGGEEAQGKGGEGEGEEEAQGQGLHPSTIRASRFLFTGF